ncbi:MAG: M23 family metallopeptidase [Luteimonas sp.]|nr:M23 family metallopeptidase [Luteimonas sp.]
MSTQILSAGLAVLLATMSMPGHSLSDTPAAPVIPAADAAARDEQAIQAGRELSQLFLHGDTAAVWERMSPQMQQALGSAAALAQFHANVTRDLGEEEAILDEATTTAPGAHVYMRTSRWSRLPTPILMQWAVDDGGKVAGFFVKPAPEARPQAASSPHLDYQTKAHLRLPFDGEWYVVWGGHDIEQNYHAAFPGQRFAYDILKVVDGSSHRGDGTALEDYYCWNQKILAPAAGTVLEVVGDLPDQAIGTRNPNAPAGNHVMLDLGNGEYALLAHLRQGSATLEAGQRVAAGDEVGRCGNSGNTSEPHLHFHLQDAPRFGEGNGLPAFFEHYTADGKVVERGEPVKGQLIAPAAGAPSE